MTKISCPYDCNGNVFLLETNNQWNFCSVENLLGRNITKALYLCYRWLSYYKLLWDLIMKFLIFCVIFLLPKKYHQNYCFLDREEKSPNQPNNQIPPHSLLIFILLWEIEKIKHTFCQTLNCFSSGTWISPW